MITARVVIWYYPLCSIFLVLIFIKCQNLRPLQMLMMVPFDFFMGKGFMSISMQAFYLQILCRFTIFLINRFTGHNSNTKNVEKSETMHCQLNPSHHSVSSSLRLHHRRPDTDSRSTGPLLLLQAFRIHYSRNNGIW